MIKINSPTKTILFLDIEADGLQEDCTKIWVVIGKDLEGTQHIFRNPADGTSIQKLIDSYDYVVMHNGINYDQHVLKKLLGVNIPRDKLIDTLVISQLLNTKRTGGHSLDNWGHILKFPKGTHVDFTKFSEEMVTYCIRDVDLLIKVFQHLQAVCLRNKDAFDKAIDVEHDARWTAYDMQHNGFKFNIDEAMKMRTELETKRDDILAQLRSAFPPKVEHIQLKTKVKEVVTEFNPGSPKQVIDRLWEYGWKPVDKTDGHKDFIKERSKDDKKKQRFERYGWKVNETNLATLPEDAPRECSLLVLHTIYASRIRTLTEWIDNYNPTSGRIHGEFNPLGTSTHRATHSKPNMGNIATAKTIKFNTPDIAKIAIDLGARMRSMWICEDDAWLVGCDMESAHLRIFAHLIDDKNFTQSLISGDKKAGTDPHSLNKKALGDICVDRDRAKTFIFSFLNGAAAPKVSEIFGCSLPRAREALDGYVQAYPGLRALKEQRIPQDASRGYFVGVDGRLVVNDSEHLMMGMYLQNMESVLMKHANMMWRKELDALGIKYRQVNWVHDEWVTEVLGDRALAERVGAIQANSIRVVGEIFNLRCPMGGEYKVGKTWLEVH